MPQELHSQELVLKHTEILAKLPEQIESICLKFARLEKAIGDMFSVRDDALEKRFEQKDKELVTAKVELDRRLDGLNHLNA